MSNFLSVAVVTAALQEMIQEALQETVPGATVRVGPPRPPAPSAGPEVSLYLYQLSPNASLRNRDLPTRRADGALVQRPSVAVDLHYLISFFGEQDLASERMLGKVASRFHAHPVLTQEQIRATVRGNGSSTYLGASDLALETDLIKLTPQFLSLEELSKLWTVFFQMAHRLSLQYIAGPVVVDADLVPLSALPIAQSSLAVSPALAPRIDRITPAAVQFGDRTVVQIQGSNLASGNVRLEIDGMDTAFERNARGHLLVRQLPGGLLAGVRQVQASAGAGVRSNTAQFLLKPRVAQAAFLLVPDPSQEAAAATVATIQVETAPLPGAGQSIRLLLNRLGASEGFTFESPMRFPIEDPAREGLENGTISAALRETFAANSVRLSSNVTLAAAAPGVWELTDSDWHRTYAIRRDAQGFTAYYGLPPGKGLSWIGFRLPAPAFVPPGAYLVRVQTGPPPLAESPLTKGVLVTEVPEPAMLTEASIAQSSAGWLRAAGRKFAPNPSISTVSPGQQWLLTCAVDGAWYLVRKSSGGKLQLFASGAGPGDSANSPFLAPLVVVPIEATGNGRAYHN
jgi:hypothetical protein